MPRVAAVKTPGEVQAPVEEVKESVSVDRSLLEALQAQIASLSS